MIRESKFHSSSASSSSGGGDSSRHVWTYGHLAQTRYLQLGISSDGTVLSNKASVQYMCLGAHSLGQASSDAPTDSTAVALSRYIPGIIP